MIVSSFVLNRFRPTNNVKPLQDCTWEDIHNYLSTNQAVENVWKVGDTNTITYNGEQTDVVLIGITDEYVTAAAKKYKTLTFQFKEAIELVTNTILPGYNTTPGVSSYYYFYNWELYNSNSYLSRSTITGGAENYITDVTDFYYNVPYLYSTQTFPYPNSTNFYDNAAFSISTFDFWHDTTSDKVRPLFLLSPYEMGVETLLYQGQHYSLKNDSYLDINNNQTVADSSMGYSAHKYEYYYNASVRKPIYKKGTTTPAKVLTRIGAYTYYTEPTSDPMDRYYPEYIGVDTSSYSSAEPISTYSDYNTYIAPCFKIIGA